MATNESLIDKRIDQTIRYSGKSDLNLRFACMSASYVVGKYSAATAQIANARKRDVSTVENWAHAYRLRLALAPQNPKLVRTLWRELSPTHWWRAYEVIHKNGYRALPHLNNAHLYDWSAPGMLAEFEKEKAAGHAPLIVSHAIHALFGLASELRKSGVQEDEAVDIVRKAYQ